MKDIRIMFMQESGDPRSNCVTQETHDMLLKAVQHFITTSPHPVKKVE